MRVPAVHGCKMHIKNNDNNVGNVHNVTFLLCFTVNFFVQVIVYCAVIILIILILLLGLCLWKIGKKQGRMTARKSNGK